MWHIIVKIVSPFTYNCLTLISLISDFYLIISPTPEVPFPTSYHPAQRKASSWKLRNISLCPNNVANPHRRKKRDNLFPSELGALAEINSMKA